MRLEELFENQSTSVVYHCTTMHNCAKILQSGIFQATKVPGRNNEYVTSVALDLQSAFIDIMYNTGSVIMFLNKNAFAQQYEMRSYVCPDARAEMGNNFDEMEEQIVSKTPTIQIPKPLNQSILKIEFWEGKTDPRGQAHYNDDHFVAFIKLCKSLQVPLRFKQH